MKRQDFLQEHRSLSTSKLSDKITDSQKKLVLLRQEKLLGKIKNPKEITVLRKTIARLKTILDEKVATEVTK